MLPMPVLVCLRQQASSETELSDGLKEFDFCIANGGKPIVVVTDTWRNSSKKVRTGLLTKGMSASFKKDYIS